MNKTNNLRAYLRDLYEGIVSKKPDASRNPQNFRSEIEAIRTGGELYEVMDASELPEDAPNGSLALVEGEPIPEAYTVSSVDELPSNAVDGSMAIVPSDSIKGKWEWKDIQSPLDLSMLNLKAHSNTYYHYANFETAYDNWIGGPFGSLTFEYKDGNLTIYLDVEEPIYTEGAFVDYPDWFELFSDVMQISFYEDLALGEYYIEGPLFTIDDFKTFIKTNCNRLSGGYSLYTHENGQWVYKCEVV